MLSKFASFRPHARVAACHQSGGLNDSWEESTGSLVSLSEEQFDNCSKQINGCNSGLMDYAFTLYKTNAIASESSHSHSARDGICETSSSDGVTGYKDVSDASGLMSALNQQPLSVTIQADQAIFQNYSTGTVTSGCGYNLAHGVLAAGYDSAAGYYPEQPFV